VRRACAFIAFMSLQLFAGFEANGFARWDGHLFTGAGIATYAAFPRFDYEHTEPAQFDPLAAGQGFFHGMEKGIDSLLGLHLWHAGPISYTIDNVQFDHRCYPFILLAL